MNNWDYKTYKQVSDTLDNNLFPPEKESPHLKGYSSNYIPEDTAGKTMVFKNGSKIKQEEKELKIKYTTEKDLYGTYTTTGETIIEAPGEEKVVAQLRDIKLPTDEDLQLIHKQIKAHIDRNERTIMGNRNLKTDYTFTYASPFSNYNEECKPEPKPREKPKPMLLKDFLDEE